PRDSSTTSPAPSSPRPTPALSRRPPRSPDRPPTWVLTPSRGPVWPHPCSPRAPILSGPPSRPRPGLPSQTPPRAASQIRPGAASPPPPPTATRIPPRTPPEAPPRSPAPPLLLPAAPAPTQFPQSSSTSCATGCSRSSERLL